jgi:hypothetical protein
VLDRLNYETYDILEFVAINVNERAKAKSRGAEIKLPPGAGAETMNCGSSFFLFIKDLKKFYRKKHVG